jgi:hypothetical protein
MTARPTTEWLLEPQTYGSLILTNVFLLLGTSESLIPTYEKMGNRWIFDFDILVFFNTPVHYAQGTH